MINQTREHCEMCGDDIDNGHAKDDPFMMYDVLCDCCYRKRLAERKASEAKAKQLEDDDKPAFGLRSRHCRFTCSSDGWL